MPRYIDADAIPYTMLYKENWLKGRGVEKLGVWKDTIDAMPTIEPERKKGKWIDDNCSECGFYVHHGDMRNFCPNCGSYNGGENDQSK